MPPNPKSKVTTLSSLASRLDTKKREPPKHESIKSDLVRKLAARSPVAGTQPASKPASKPFLSRAVSATPVMAPRIPQTKSSTARVPSTTLQKVVAPKSNSKRNYPRVGVSVRASLALADNPSSVFQASLPTVNVSVGGLFLESSFFLKLGTKLLVTLELPPENRMVKAKGEVVRVDSSEKGQSGFAIRFTEYLDGSEVVLATNFLSPVLREFINEYAQVHQFKADENYLSHVTDVLAAWELKKAKLGDIWAT